MNKNKHIFSFASFALLLFVASILGGFYRWLPGKYTFFFTVTYILSVGIYIALFASWTISVYKRIMQKQVRAYLMLIGGNILLWISIRGIKWWAFRDFPFGDRISWYLYYVPMIMIPLLFFFVSLYTAEEENYRPSKKWSLLFIPAILLILLVLTNDFHMLVFSGFDITKHLYGMNYDYGIGYFFIAIFMGLSMVMSLFLIVRKFIASPIKRKAARLPFLVILGIFIYTVLHILKPNYGIGYYFMDVTTFGCGAAVAFWEACIISGLVHANSFHEGFFKRASTKGQILDSKGSAIYVSKGAPVISPKEFEGLKTFGSIDYDEKTLLHMHPIRGGYVSWSSDVSDIKETISRFEDLNKSLNEKATLLTLENEEKKESAREKKQNELHTLLLTQALPYSEKIKNTIMINEDVSLDKMKHLLFQTSVISTYLKRKINLILTYQAQKYISIEEMKRAFLESFELFRFYLKTCEINITDDFNLNLKKAILCYDLFQGIIENVGYNFNCIYINYKLRGEDIVFSIDIEGDIKSSILKLKDFEKEKISTLEGNLKISQEIEGYHFCLIIPK